MKRYAEYRNSPRLENDLSRWDTIEDISLDNYDYDTNDERDDLGVTRYVLGDSNIHLSEFGTELNNEHRIPTMGVELNNEYRISRFTGSGYYPYRVRGEGGEADDGTFAGYYPYHTRGQGGEAGQGLFAGYYPYHTRGDDIFAPRMEGDLEISIKHNGKKGKIVP